MTDDFILNNLEVFQAGKPVFIDKPTGSRLAEVVAIYQAAEHYRAKVSPVHLYV